MESFALMLSVPASFIATIIYISILHILKTYIPRWSIISNYIFYASLGIIVTFVTEFIGVSTWGAINLRVYIGPVYYCVHLILFFLVIPSLANVLQLQKKVSFFSNWVVTAFICAVLALFVALLQYDVTETLYGIDGMKGPFVD
jgi:hypothetical protein